MVEFEHFDPGVDYMTEVPPIRTDEELLKVIRDLRDQHSQLTILDDIVMLVEAYIIWHRVRRHDSSPNTLPIVFGAMLILVSGTILGALMTSLQIPQDPTTADAFGLIADTILSAPFWVGAVVFAVGLTLIVINDVVGR